MNALVVIDSDIIVFLAPQKYIIDGIRCRRTGKVCRLVECGSNGALTRLQ